MNIGTILTELGQGLASIIPSIFGAIYDAFKALFLTTGTEGAVTGFNELAVVVLSFFLLYFAYRMIPVVTAFLNKRISARKKAKAKK